MSILKNQWSDSMTIHVGGFEPLTTIDYPDHLSCVVFTQGCPWRCGYCHNHDLIAANKPTAFDWGDILKFIKSRQGLLDAVVFSGGEPCLQSDLFQAITQVKALGFKVGLHTGGAYPQRLKRCLPLVDWVGFDIKHLPLHYDLVTQTPHSAQKAWQSLELLLDSGVEQQLRITRHPSLMSDEELVQLQRLIRRQYHQELIVQTCNTSQCLDEKLRLI